ncbi:uncharacterized protein LOC144164705 [Haemaphysalis longicornis]
MEPESDPRYCCYHCLAHGLTRTAVLVTAEMEQENDPRCCCYHCLAHGLTVTQTAATFTGTCSTSRRPQQRAMLVLCTAALVYGQNFLHSPTLQRSSGVLWRRPWVPGDGDRARQSRRSVPVQSGSCCTQ